MNTWFAFVSHSIQNSHCATLFLDAFLKSFIVLALAGGVCALWRRSSAATRHLIWFLAVASLPCLPLLALLLPSWQRPLWSVATGFDSGNQVSMTLELMPGTMPVTFAQTPQTSPAVAGASDADRGSTRSNREIAARFSANWLVFGLIVWFAGAVLVLISAASGQLRLRKFSRIAQPLQSADWTLLLEEVCETLRLRRAVNLLQSTDNVMPLTWGWWRPAVLLPAESGQWPAERRRIVLLHELAHVKRWDCLTQFAAKIVCALYWFNPLAWLAARQMCIERERACDDLVLNGGCKASDYAGHLVEIARSFRRVPQMAGIAMARPSGLEQRVTAILDGQRNRQRMARMAMILIVLALFGLEFLVGGYAKENSAGTWLLKSSGASVQLKAFVAEKEAQARAGTNDVSVFQTFFAAAAKGDWLTVSNAFVDFRNHAGQYEHSDQTKIDERLRGTAWQVVLEIWGAFYAFGDGDEKYSMVFGTNIIASIPPGSIYFGGTDAGRFIVTALQKSHVKADPFFTLTQNALADSTYLDYLRGMYGNKLYVPTTNDLQKSFQDYTEDVTQRRSRNQLRPGEDYKTGPDGKIQVSGQMAVVQVDGLVAKVIFDKNPDHGFYIEESFPFDWLYPYLEPHGLIMKINRQPLAALPEDVVSKDHDYWAKCVQPMIGDWLNDGTPVEQVAAFAQKTFGKQDFTGFAGDPRFIQNAYSHRTFSKLRSSQAGVYAWRLKQAADAAEKERMARAADFAFRQAWALCPYSPEAVFRYVNFLLGQKRSADALVVGETAAQMPAMQGQDGEQIRDLMKHLKEFQKAKQTSSGGK
ncbi:MAG: M56 family metallopeptidase [Limisphaerales bacterium]